MITNEIDKLKIAIPFEFVKNQSNENSAHFLGGNFKKGENNYIIEVSGKLFSTPRDFGSITANNIENLTSKIEKNCGLKIDNFGLLCCSQLCRVDVKKDLIVEDNPSFYISAMREKLKKNTDKYDIYKYSNLGYANGLAVIPKAKSAKYRFSIYIKGVELRQNRRKHPEYYENFEFTFLKQANQTIRCEYQATSYAQIREVFELNPKEPPRVLSIFDCKKDVVAEQFSKLAA